MSGIYPFAEPVGSKVNANNTHNVAYFIVDGESIIQDVNKEESFLEGVTKDGCEYSLTSNVIDTYCLLKVDGIRRTVDKEGLNIAVYSKKTRKVVDSVVIIGHSVVKHGPAWLVKYRTNSAVLLCNNWLNICVLHVMPENSSSNSNLKLWSLLNCK